MENNTNSMDLSGLMKNLNGMLENGAVPDNIKAMLSTMKNNSSTTNSSDSNNIPNSSTDSTTTNTNTNTNTMNFDPEMLQNLMRNFQSSTNGNNSNTSSDSSSSNPGIDFEMLLKLKAIMEKMQTNKDDPRSNLLLSLKPYLKPSRKDKIEQYIQLFNMSKVIDVFGQNGGGKK